METALLRHGETTASHVYCGSSDVPLTEEGWRQMRDATALNKQWTRIVSSPLMRCSEFARQLACERGIPLVLDDRLREMDFGRWEKKSATEIHQNEPRLLAQFWQNPLEHAPPDGEFLCAMQHRVLSAWHEIARWPHPQLVITHGGPIRIILCEQQQHPIEKLLELEVPLASLKTIIHQPNNFLEHSN